ncbi:Acetoin utilization deacetylase AcuC [Ectothiorhodosinus mongolicus]|uniref:Acetoin utilization deacetylase AcuC n=1 Tax=Ectothiorhodosinus mongolicus TaxID=233100 RepID=A0A1R3VXE4_9GAMM|nr:histone deacetylase family protein [Ectothiorhodosinus mongolicus]ULX57081.1 deacetylase [Ectothiorhodosinus mongolicus]SIT69815.1 Acetoin utilization deacetylase AcuC [Ectothiorhodosinus mongolicus]
MSIAFITHHDCTRHEMTPEHPEAPERLGAIDDRLLASGIGILLRHYDAPLATNEAILRAHAPAYLAWLEQQVPEKGSLALLDQGDTAINAYSLTAARRAAGAAVLAVDLVMSGEASSAFCSVRPPGHHAERARAMGFCIFNNVAVAAMHALEHHHLSRVAIVDFDVHHGNGTEEICSDKPQILFCSTFQHPFYPFVGEASDTDTLVNVPLPAGTGSAAFRQAIRDHWLPALERVKPELIIISAGFDAHREEDMGGMSLVEDDFAWVTQELKAIAKRHSQGRLVSCLEGGYNLSSLGRSVTVHLDALIGH